MKVLFLGKPEYRDLYEKIPTDAGNRIVELKDSPDLGVIAYYGKIIPKKELEIPKYGFINIHPSLLPKYRGPSPVRSAILAGDKKTGVTIHRTRAKVDAGEIILQREFEIDPKENYQTLEDRLFLEGAIMLPEAMDLYINKKVEPKIQDESLATYTRIFNTEDGRIVWTKSSQQILNQIRALSPNPGVFTTLNGKRLLILGATWRPGRQVAGTIETENAGFKIAANDGFIVPTLIKLEGKKETTPESFLNGHKDIVGRVLR